MSGTGMSGTGKHLVAGLSSGALIVASALGAMSGVGTGSGSSIRPPAPIRRGPSVLSASTSSSNGPVAVDYSCVVPVVGKDLFTATVAGGGPGGEGGRGARVERSTGSK
jgi:hypothetical protein